jgi:glycosyltransferase involved in cell wall biosynthesis
MKIGLVIPWYSKDIIGGAETEAKRIIENLTPIGIVVEVLTTCVESFYSDWNIDYYPAGEEIINEIVVKRFPVRKRDTARFDRINKKLMKGSQVSETEEKAFMEEMVNSPDLYRYLKEFSKDYDYFMFIPYMFGTTFYGSLQCPEKSILIPCLHDESYAHMKIYEKMFASAKGIIFHSHAEEAIAQKIYCIDGVRSKVIGGGVDSDFEGHPDHFRNKYNIDGKFLMYAGRKESGKNVPCMVDYFTRYIDTHKDGLKLILIGPGKADIPTKYLNRIIDLGYVAKQDKYDAYAAATAFCNPSVNESFSIVIMESWLCEVPVIVNSDCAVTREHCINSNAGLYYSNYEEFEACIEFYLDNTDIGKKMGRLGRKYVLGNYTWGTIVDRYKQFFRSLGE